jgi:hypothetical protein
MNGRVVIYFCDICRRLWGQEHEDAPYYDPPVVVCRSCWDKVSPL